MNRRLAVKNIVATLAVGSSSLSLAGDGSVKYPADPTRRQKLLAEIDARTDAWIESPYSISDRDLSSGLQLLAEANQAEVLTPRHINAAARALIAHWRLDEARELVKALPQWNGLRLPSIVTPKDEWPRGGFRLWNIDGAGNARLSALDLERGSKVIVTTGLGCGFSRRALHDIKARVELTARLAPHVKFISLPDAALNVDAITEWQKRNDPFQLDFIHRISDWPMIQKFATPAFYFYSGGEQMQVTTGWPEGGNMEALEAGLQIVGL